MMILLGGFCHAILLKMCDIYSHSSYKFCSVNFHFRDSLNSCTCAVDMKPRPHTCVNMRSIPTTPTTRTLHNPPRHITGRREETYGRKIVKFSVYICSRFFIYPLQWHLNERHGVWNHRRYDWLLSPSDQINHQSSGSLAFVKGIHRWPVDSPRNEPVTQKMFLFDDVIMFNAAHYSCHNTRPRPRWGTKLRTPKGLYICHIGRVQANCLQMRQYIDGLVQGCSNSNALAVELLQSCTKPY